METIAQSEIFFFISSIGFIILALLVAYAVVQIIRAARSFASLMDKIEENVDSVGDAGREMIDDMRSSVAFRLLFRPGRRRD